MKKNTNFILRSKLPLVLASKSTSRRNILLKTGLEFEQIFSNVNEERIKKKFKNINFINLAKKLAEQKALEVSKIKKESYIIGADQICVNQKKILSKPKFKRKALEQLISLNGKTHKQISAVCVCYNESVIWSYTEIAKMKMRKLPINVLKEYINIDLPLESCGSYKFESHGKYLFSKIDGNTNTILGLPIFPLLNILLKKKNNSLCLN